MYSSSKARKTARLKIERLESRDCPTGSYLVVTDYDQHEVLRYDAATGAFVDQFVPKHSGGLNHPQSLVFGPHDHNFYVGSGHFEGPGQLKAVLRYDGGTGVFQGAFAESGRLTSVHAVLFGPDGNLYVGDWLRYEGSVIQPGRILRFDGTTGAFLDEFVPTGSGGLIHPISMVFASDKRGRLDLYVSNGPGNILRYDGTTGAFVEEFVARGRGGLDLPAGLSFGPDGNLYVTDSGFRSGIAQVLRYQGPTGRNPGAFIDVFVGSGSGDMLNAEAAIFGPDGNGDGRHDLYVTNAQFTGHGEDRARNGSVKRYDGVTGAFIDTFVPVGSGGLNHPVGLTFTETDPVTLAYKSGGKPRIHISNVSKSEGKKGKTTLFTFTVTLSAAYDEPVTMSFQTVNGTATTSDNDSIAKTGTLTFAPGETTTTITIEVKGDSKTEANEKRYLDLFGLSNKSLFTKNRALGTILNDD
jgi:hypothetical protein